MAFTPDKWKDGESGGTPITAAELNRIEAAGSAAASAVPAWADVTGKPATFPPESHSHSASEVSSGTLAVARIPSLAVSKITGLQATLDDLEARVAALEGGGAA